MPDGGTTRVSARRSAPGSNRTIRKSRNSPTNTDGFADLVGDRLPAERRAVYKRLIEEGHRRNARYHSHRNMPLLHGDSHVWNVFLPRDGGNDVRLFDWPAWRADVATDDLAYMMALHWFPDHRRRYERRLLDHYHENLLANGVNSYARPALDDDHRLSVLWQLATTGLAGDPRHPVGDLVAPFGAHLSGDRRSGMS